MTAHANNAGTALQPIFGLQIGPQNVPWPELRRWVLKAETLGYDEAWLADHFISTFRNSPEPYIEMWSGLAALAAVTSRIRLGSLVASVTHRNPGITAVSAATIDRIAGGGRFILGLGAGWSVQEHRAYGIPLPPPATRMAMLAEAIQICRLLWTEDRPSFQGRYFQLGEAPSEIKPLPGHPIPILVGAMGEQLGLRVVARHADIWNMVGGIPDVVRRKSALLDQYCAEAGRDPATLVRSIEVPFAVATDAATLNRRLDWVSRHRGYPRDTIQDKILAGSPAQCIARIEQYLAMGVTQFMLITLTPFDDEELELFAGQVIPAFR
jgi:alkanesulfonate monooxygenase SsuD/methylene tetrahydromethanopterin reductase-like flavin-dependent oxidoreductase (luciferase family)